MIDTVCGGNMRVNQSINGACRRWINGYSSSLRENTVLFHTTVL